MLVRFTDIKGRDFWINPIHVKLLQPARGGQRTDIVLTYRGGWGANHVVSVATPIDDVAHTLNAAMPPLVDYVPDDESEQLAAPGAGAPPLMT